MEPNEVSDWKTQWKKVEFTAELKIVSYSRGRSAANIVACDVDKAKYTIFLTDYIDMLHNGDIVDNQITGVWIVRKRGRNFGVKLKSTPNQVEVDGMYQLNRSPIPAYLYLDKPRW
ncbi:MAG: hypothetical protein GY862_09690 [Gammaproteobacteria bacterium]|nr:hypothetical protein [Gammaproteobacteria bacterium]